MSDEQGRDLKALAEQPELELHLEWVWQAFWDLVGDRQIGLSEGPIMWVSIEAYGRRHQIHGDRFDRLFAMLRRMDSAYLRARAPKKTDGKTK